MQYGDKSLNNLKNPQFGANVTSDALVSFRPETAVTIAVIVIAVKASTMYPILLCCGR